MHKIWNRLGRTGHERFPGRPWLGIGGKLGGLSHICVENSWSECRAGCFGLVLSGSSGCWNFPFLHLPRYLLITSLHGGRAWNFTGPKFAKSHSRGATRKGRPPVAEEQFSVNTSPDTGLPRGSPTALRAVSIFMRGLTACTSGRPRTRSLTPIESLEMNGSN